MGFCTQEELTEFFRTCPEFELMLIRSGIILLKYWFSVSDDEQERRFQARHRTTPTKSWKLSPMDLESRARWVDYSRAKDEMFRYTDTKQSPWWVVEADDKATARLNCIHHLLEHDPLLRAGVTAPRAAGAPGRHGLRPPPGRGADVRAGCVLSYHSGRMSAAGWLARMVAVAGADTAIVKMLKLSRLPGVRFEAKAIRVPSLRPCRRRVDRRVVRQSGRRTAGHGRHRVDLEVGRTVRFAEKAIVPSRRSTTTPARSRWHSTRSA